MNAYIKAAHEKKFTKYVIFGFFMILSGCVNSEQPTIADNKTNNFNRSVTEKYYNFQKYTVITKMYSDAVLNKYNEENNTLDHLYKYSDKSLKDAITLSSKNITNTSESLDSMKSCEKAILILDLIPSTSYELDDILEIDHKILNNGYIRSKMLVKGYEKINSYNFGTFKDFSLDCENGDCMITDVFDSEGNSAKQKVKLLCK